MSSCLGSEIGRGSIEVDIMVVSMATCGGGAAGVCFGEEFPNLMTDGGTVVCCWGWDKASWL